MLGIDIDRDGPLVPLIVPWPILQTSSTGTRQRATTVPWCDSRRNDAGTVTKDAGGLAAASTGTVMPRARMLRSLQTGTDLQTRSGRP